MSWAQVALVTLAFLGVYLQFAAFVGRCLRDAQPVEPSAEDEGKLKIGERASGSR